MEFVVSIILFVINLFVFKFALSQRDGTIINPFVLFYYPLQAITALVILMIDVDYSINLVGFSIKLRDTIFPYMLGSTCAVFGIFCGMQALNIVYRNKADLPLTQKCMLICFNQNVDVLAFLLGILSLFNIIAVFFSFYIINVVFLTFSFVPIIVGLIWFRMSRPMQLFWGLILVVGLLFHSVQGSRGYALMPILLFAIGYYISMKTFHPEILGRRRIIAILFLLIVFPFLSKVQDFRDNRGRGLEVSAETVLDLISFMGDDSESQETSGLKGSLGRMLNEPNFTIPYTCPSPIPYRGSDAMLDELKTIYVLNGAEGAEIYLKKRAYLNYGVGALSRYGYYITDKTSTGLSMFADGYSRFGYFGVFFYSAVFAFVLGFIEKFALNLWNKNVMLSILFYFFILRLGLFSYGSTYYSFFKIVLFRSVLLFLIGYLIYRICNANFLQKR